MIHQCIMRLNHRMKFIVTLCKLVYALDLLRLMGFSINFQVTIDFLAL